MKVFLPTDLSKKEKTDWNAQADTSILFALMLQCTK